MNLKPLSSSESNETWVVKSSWQVSNGSSTSRMEWPEEKGGEFGLRRREDTVQE